MIMNSIMHLKVFPIFAVSVHINGLYTRFFNPIYYPCKNQRPSCYVQFFLLYIKTTRINYLVKFLSKPPPSFQPSISQIIWIYVCILHNKEKEKISKKLRIHVVFQLDISILIGAMESCQCMVINMQSLLHNLL